MSAILPASFLSAQPLVPDILWWRFTDGAGNVTATVGPNGTNTSGTWVADNYGRAGRALQFAGSPAYLKSASAITYGVKTITVSAWFYWDTFSNDDAILWESSVNINSNVYTFLLDPNSSTPGGLAATIYANTGNYRIDYITRPSAASWHHIAIVYTDTGAFNCVVYIDGVAQSMSNYRSDTPGNTNFSQQVFYLFSRGGSSFFGKGRISDLRIYGRALSLQEINAIKSVPC